MNYDEIYKNFVGKNKIQPLEVFKDSDSDMWILKYKEGNKYADISCEVREDLDKILIEFGGKNPDTCRAPDKFMELSDWNSEDLNNMGHIIQKISFSGSRLVRSTHYPILFPENTGHSTIIDKKGATKNNTFNLRLMDRELMDYTLGFKSRDEFDNLINFLKTHETLKKLTWTVMLLGTESRETKDQCVWKRLKAGDGTKRMVLELVGLNGRHFTHCVRADLFNAAGDMFDSPCKRVSIKKKKQIEEEICLFAAEDGKIDMSRFDLESTT